MPRKFHIAEGLVREARQCPSPNHNQRPAPAAISLLVIHNISLPPGQFGGDYVERFFTNRLPAEEHPFFAEIAALRVSAHLFIDRQGELVQFVPLQERAWHAGVSCFEGMAQCNDFSIGIELEGVDSEPYSDPQYDALVALTQAIRRCYPAITPERITGHADIAPGRKTDPGPAFDWQRYRAALAARSADG